MNKLSLNISKTNFIHFQSSNSFRNETLPNDIFIYNSQITVVTNTKFLEVIINSRLTLDDHINTVSSKLSKNIGILVKINYKIPSATLIQLYHTCVQSYLEYCNIIWAADSNISLTTLFIKQEKEIRIISHSSGMLILHQVYQASYINII